VNVVEELDKILEQLRGESAATYDIGVHGPEKQTTISIGRLRGLTFAIERISTLRRKLSAPTTGAE
jgi:hypothetical protein